MAAEYKALVTAMVTVVTDSRTKQTRKAIRLVADGVGCFLDELADSDEICKLIRETKPNEHGNKVLGRFSVTTRESVRKDEQGNTVRYLKIASLTPAAPLDEDLVW